MRGISNAMIATILRVATMQMFATIIVYAAREYSPPEECGLYLAPSSIPGAGLGMYSGSKAYEKQELISDGDLMITQWDMDLNNGDDEYYNLWNEYTWSGSKFTILNAKTSEIVLCWSNYRIFCLTAHEKYYFRIFAMRYRSV